MAGVCGSAVGSVATATAAAAAAARRAGGGIKNGGRGGVVLSGLGKTWVALPSRTRRRGGSRTTGGVVRAESSSSSSDGGGGGTTTKEDSVKDVILDSTALPQNFCIIEGASNNQVRDFADMAQDELLNNIESRKNRVFIMLEEVRRLRVQLQLKNKDAEVRRLGWYRI